MGVIYAVFARSPTVVVVASLGLVVAVAALGFRRRGHRVTAGLIGYLVTFEAVFGDAGLRSQVWILLGAVPWIIASWTTRPRNSAG